MKEQLWGFGWQLVNRLLGVHHPLSFWFESRWVRAYWAAQPPLGDPHDHAQCNDC